MVRLVSHGGHCCGAYHIYGFGGAEGDNIVDLRNCISNAPNGRLLEICLNDSQCNAKPRLLAEMARLGFVFTNRWINSNHNSHVNQFIRCDRRVALDNKRWAWEGMIIEPTLHGNLPFMNGQQIGGPRALVRGQRVRINSPTSRWHGQEGTFISRYNDWNAGEKGRVDMGYGQIADLVIRNIVAIDNPAPVQVEPPQRHEGIGVGGPAPAPVVVHTTYHNRYRDGRVSPGYETIAIAARAAPRCHERFRRDIMSDGRQVETAL